MRKTMKPVNIAIVVVALVGIVMTTWAYVGSLTEARRNAATETLWNEGSTKARVRSNGLLSHPLVGPDPLPVASLKMYSDAGGFISLQMPPYTEASQTITLPEGPYHAGDILLLDGAGAMHYMSLEKLSTPEQVEQARDAALAVTQIRLWMAYEEEANDAN